MVADDAVQGFDDMKVAVAEAVSTKNNLSCNGGFSPSLWVFGTLQEFADLGPLQGQLERPDAQNLEVRPDERSYAKTRKWHLDSYEKARTDDQESAKEDASPYYSDKEKI